MSAERKQKRKKASEDSSASASASSVTKSERKSVAASSIPGYEADEKFWNDGLKRMFKMNDFDMPRYKYLPVGTQSAVRAARIAAETAPTYDAMVDANVRTAPAQPKVWAVFIRGPIGDSKEYQSYLIDSNDKSDDGEQMMTDNIQRIMDCARHTSNKGAPNVHAAFKLVFGGYDDIDHIKVEEAGISETAEIYADACHILNDPEKYNAWFEDFEVRTVTIPDGAAQEVYNVMYD